MPYCKGTRRDGSPCGRLLMEEGYCFQHLKADRKQRTPSIPTNTTTGRYSTFLLPDEEEWMQERLSVEPSEFDTIEALLSIQIKRVAKHLTRRAEAESNNDSRLLDRLLVTKSVRTIEGTNDQDITEVIRELPDGINDLVALVRALNDSRRAKVQEFSTFKKGDAPEELAKSLKLHLEADKLSYEDFQSLPIGSTDPFSND
jgi:hypothetical protein